MNDEKPPLPTKFTRLGPDLSASGTAYLNPMLAILEEIWGFRVHVAFVILPMDNSMCAEGAIVLDSFAGEPDSLRMVADYINDLANEADPKRIIIPTGSKTH